MLDTLQAIRTRRSIRKYEHAEIDDDLLNEVLNAVRWAQSWANTQCWEIVVVRDQEVKKKLQAAVPSGNPSRSAILQAPVVLAICGKQETAGYYQGEMVTKFGDWMLFDLGIVTENIALAAHALDLGTVVVGLLDHEAAEEALAVPEDYEISVLMPLGFPAEEVVAPPRREVTEFTHYDKF